MKRIIIILSISIVVVAVIGFGGSWKISATGLIFNLLLIPQIYALVTQALRAIQEYIPAFKRAIRMGRNLKPIIALLDAQERNYRDYLTIRVMDLIVDAEEEKVNLKFELSNNLLWDISLLEFRGSAKFDAKLASEDLKLSTLISSYQFEKCRHSEISISFPIKLGVLNQLKNKKKQKDKAYWEIDTKWDFQFPTGKKEIWKANAIRFEEIPRIGEGTS